MSGWMRLNDDARRLAVRMAAALVLACGPAGAAAQDTETPGLPDSRSATDLILEDAKADVVRKKLEEATEELAAVRKKIADEKIWMSERLHRLENQQIDARKNYEDVKRQLDRRRLDMNNLREEIETREKEKSYLFTLLDEYIRNLQSRLHASEIARYEEEIEKARLAPDNTTLSPSDVFGEQANMVSVSVQRLTGMLGGAKFEGRAAGDDGLVKDGNYVFLGPLAFFASEDGSLAGVAELQNESLDPLVAGFADPQLSVMTRELVADGEGAMPFDASLGNARKVEQTRQTLVEHIKKGGPVMVPILGIASIALVVALIKWLSLSLVRMPKSKQIRKLLEAVADGDKTDALEAVRKVPGPSGAMLKVGAEHLNDPKDLIEEVMFEKMLDARFSLQKALPFIAVTAASAPLLGLLGTVTGIINTFKLITVFGSGDVKMLSAGISEALITTEFGLIVAIPSLLFHAFLSRKAKGITETMEQHAVAFLSVISKKQNKEAEAV